MYMKDSDQRSSLIICRMHHIVDLGLVLALALALVLTVESAADGQAMDKKIPFIRGGCGGNCVDTSCVCQKVARFSVVLNGCLEVFLCCASAEVCAVSMRASSTLPLSHRPPGKPGPVLHA